MSRENKQNNKKKYRSTPLINFINEKFNEQHPKKKLNSKEYYIFILQILHFALKDINLGDEEIFSVIKAARDLMVKSHSGYKTIIDKTNQILINHKDKKDLKLTLNDYKESFKKHTQEELDSEYHIYQSLFKKRKRNSFNQEQKNKEEFGYLNTSDEEWFNGIFTWQN